MAFLGTGLILSVAAADVHPRCATLGPNKNRALSRLVPGGAVHLLIRSFESIGADDLVCWATVVASVPSPAI
eukprot:12703117-Alexandrium_andersonii.AAC.1